MNKKKIIYAIGAAALVGFTSCSKNLLNLNPTSQIALDQSFTQVSDAQKWDAGLYAILRGDVYGNTIMGPDFQSDEMNATIDYGNNYGDQQTWAGFTSSDGTLSGIWSAFYYAIADVDVAIAGFADIKPTDATDSASLNQYLGDAYLARAYCFHQLALRFCKAYNPGSASSDLGIPLTLVYNVNALPKRATMADTYAQILSDLANARVLLNGVTQPAQGSATFANYFTQDAVLALEARVYLDMQNWNMAQLTADSLIASGTYPLTTTQAAFNSLWATDNPQESILQLASSQPNEAPPSEFPYINYNTATSDNDPYYVPSLWVVQLYSPADFRYNGYFMNTTVTMQGTQYSGIYLVNKFPGNPSLWTASVSDYENAPKVFRIAEDYLISAEAAAQAGDPAVSLAALNALREARGLTDLTGLTGAVLMDSVQAERTKELAFEGFRLDDLKRWGLGFTRHGPQNPSILVPGANYVSLSEPAGADQFVWGIPQNDMTINPNLVQNPGW